MTVMFGYVSVFSNDTRSASFGLLFRGQRISIFEASCLRFWCKVCEKNTSLLQSKLWKSRLNLGMIHV
ncbi:hypothetical protein T4C_12576 [Trichinella pseudospiralis]|uniref:Uncharacterized protein n=1 Tax=Trichinella pseudospiralis TaxID=6337 RepID=A0A0V1JJX4_TRIPS|nr:hypothetical protein T4C_12576 [Trichinella pseudospiralis]